MLGCHFVLSYISLTKSKPTVKGWKTSKFRILCIIYFFLKLILTFIYSPMQLYTKPLREMGLMVLTLSKLFPMQFQQCWLNLQLKINWLGIRSGPNHTNSMVMEMKYFLYAVTIGVSLLLLHVRYVVSF